MTGRQEYDRTKDRQRILGKYMIDLSRVLCLCVTIAERSSILLVLVSNWPRRRGEGLGEGGIRDGQKREGDIEKEGCEETFHCLIQTKEKCRFTVPPGVALLNYISCGILWRIFWQSGIFAGFSLYIINFVGRISEAAIAGDILLFSIGGPVQWEITLGPILWFFVSFFYILLARRNSEAAMGGSWVGARGGGHYFFRAPNSLEGCDGWAEGREILYIKASVVQWKYRPWRPEFGLERKHFVSGNSQFFFIFVEQRSCDGGGRAAPHWGVVMSPKRLCAQRTGAHAPKPTNGDKYFSETVLLSLIWICSYFLLRVSKF
jgi:hypothetical protein